mmetsp:Transcript_27517/g.40656  ORF Transcript_27517/g.40656 Transcript_27517/m.40656 type:complete len:194 (+) Transcript_27517:165-746(+)|eukprot:CAMPEP_0194205374 /NCGR_PEP_ID=MMETSP0156-20130528/4663_1 /TAXON_ID=33649 /ORGANISM="Thalassionema nitzschioides, Strain L26-B" /LENGTH=193 /DNA_ID=CAMNT_0038931627 /DNA_START=83 /DNA_END=664 /DNA_ORIENTATION=+
MGCAILNDTNITRAKAISVMKKDRLHHSRAVSVDSFFFDLTTEMTIPKPKKKRTDFQVDTVVANAWLQQQQQQSTRAASKTSVLLKKKNKRKMVAFGKVQIREHSVVMGAPSEETVLPVQLGWEYNQHSDVSIDQHANTVLAATRRRTAEELRLTPKMRLVRLSQAGGYTDRQLMKAQRVFLQNERNLFFRAV